MHLLLEPCPKSYDNFVTLVKTISRKHIPRGCRTEYIAGLKRESKATLERYKSLYEEDSFAGDTTQAGEDVLQAVSAIRTEMWSNLVTYLDTKQNSSRAGKLLKNINKDPSGPTPDLTELTADH